MLEVWSKKLEADKLWRKKNPGQLLSGAMTLWRAKLTKGKHFDTSGLLNVFLENIPFLVFSSFLKLSLIPERRLKTRH